MSSRLQYAPRDYALAWFEDGEEGATVGQEFYPSKGRSKLAIQQTTNALAERLAKKTNNKEATDEHRHSIATTSVRRAARPTHPSWRARGAARSLRTCRRRRPARRGARCSCTARICRLEST